MMKVRAFIVAAAAAACSGAATLSPSAASSYKYVVPPVEQWPLVNGVGMGETFSGVLRYTDVAFLSNAAGEFAKIKNDIFTTPRYYRPYAQTTNNIPIWLTNPAAYIGTAYYGNVNFGTSASDAVPEYLDSDKDLTAISLPTGYSGSVHVAWPLMANVTERDRWGVTNLFYVMRNNSSGRPLAGAAITNAYWSLNKIHSLKILCGSISAETPSGYTSRIEGERVNEVFYPDYDEDNMVSWESTTYTNSTYYGGLPSQIGSPGAFEYVVYVRRSKSYNATDQGFSGDKSLAVSDIEHDDEKWEFYNIYSTTSSVPRTFMLNAPIEKVHNASYGVIGDDISWSSRIASYKRMSLFSVKRYIQEYYASVDEYGTKSSTQEVSTAYVLVDTTGSDSCNIEEQASSSYYGQFVRVWRGFFQVGSPLDFFRQIAGNAAELAAECQNPRMPEDDGYGYPDYFDTTERKVAIKVSHVWSVSYILPRYTCTVDGH